jgi:hypothetical protein
VAVAIGSPDRPEIWTGRPFSGKSAREQHIPLSNQRNERKEEKGLVELVFRGGEIVWLHSQMTFDVHQSLIGSLF